ncbi:MAG TPA: hypothetical protein VE442_17855 [Jatrophihabitans sp.]|jgi:hypothetical protein|nr:hypothetical protein [Jatrophihabitans sp.]
MNGISYALRALHHGEQLLARELLHTAETHVAEHEVHHVARDLARWSQQHIRLLAERAQRLGVPLDDVRQDSLGAPRHATSAADGESGLLLLEDLRHIYLRASENSVDWELLAQVAQAKRNAELIQLTQQCHPETLRQIRWANTMIKTLAPQTLSSM